MDEGTLEIRPNVVTECTKRKAFYLLCRKIEHLQVKNCFFFFTCHRILCAINVILYSGRLTIYKVYVLAHIVYPSSVNYVFLSNDDKAVLTKKIKKCLNQGWIKVILNFVF